MSSLVEVPCTASRPLSLYTVCRESTREAACKVIHLELKESCRPVAIQFRNYYTHTVSVLTKEGESNCWSCAVNNWPCMRESCHCETGGQSWILIDTLSVLTDITELRLVLRQPSPVWKDFWVKDISVYCHGNQEDVTPSNEMAEIISRNLTAMAAIARASPVKELFSNVDSLTTD